MTHERSESMRRCILVLAVAAGCGGRITVGELPDGGPGGGGATASGGGAAGGFSGGAQQAASRAAHQAALRAARQAARMPGRRSRRHRRWRGRHCRWRSGRHCRWRSGRRCRWRSGRRSRWRSGRHSGRLSAGGCACPAGQYACATGCCPYLADLAYSECGGLLDVAATRPDWWSFITFVRGATSRT